MVAVFESKSGGGMLVKCLLGDVNLEVSVWTPIPLEGWSEEEVCTTYDVSGKFFV